jgi:hypothetical protein
MNVDDLIKLGQEVLGYGSPVVSDDSFIGRHWFLSKPEDNFSLFVEINKDSFWVELNGTSHGVEFLNQDYILLAKELLLLSYRTYTRQ